MGSKSSHPAATISRSCPTALLPTCFRQYSKSIASAPGIWRRYLSQHSASSAFQCFWEISRNAGLLMCKHPVGFDFSPVHPRDRRRVAEVVDSDGKIQRVVDRADYRFGKPLPHQVLHLWMPLPHMEVCPRPAARRRLCICPEPSSRRCADSGPGHRSTSTRRSCDGWPPPRNSTASALGPGQAHDSHTTSRTSFPVRLARNRRRPPITVDQQRGGGRNRR